MFAATLNRLAISLPSLLRFRTVEKSLRQGPMPTWINDPQLSEQLLKDTGLAPDDLGMDRACETKKPSFMQHSSW